MKRFIIAVMVIGLIYFGYSKLDNKESTIVESAQEEVSDTSIVADTTIQDTVK